MQRIIGRMAIVRATIMIVLLIAATNVQAQGPDTFDEPSPAQDVPLDGGVSLLLAGTAAYGIKKLQQKKS
ncbi:MAG TPA: hypothetical protein DCL43_12080 [Chitinophagaceae bacterium]|nr:hypothetical protein [Chitinophagaceae bacterium]HAN38805.1 hypothetical protein [Chitinophagaceae bacterium]